MQDTKKTTDGIKVAVGMSGGVDSSVAAALLVEQGYEVIGVFMKFWSEEVKGKIRENICCSLESSEDARRVCQKLGIPFYVINMEVPFKAKIVDDFIEQYEAGRTPNPCV
ncbi:MAG: tRNA 2-thiouridine(34) synthase MnmA, partial [Patescibacteria group bacterium]